MAQTPANPVIKGAVIPYPGVSRLATGDVVLLGNFVTVTSAVDPNQAIAEQELHTEGVFDFPKTTATFSAGDAVYWNPSGSPVTGTASSGAAQSSATAYLAGVATVAALTGDSYVRAKLPACQISATIAGAVTASDITGSDSSLGITGITGNNGAGGAIVITGGVGNNNSNGGSITITAGAGDGTGVAGSITFGNMPRIPVATVVVGGTAIANANAVTEGYTRVTGSDNTAAIKLPTPVAGAQCIVKNSVATAILIVFPAVGTQINAKGNNNAYNMPNASVRHFIAFNAAVWETAPETIV